MPILRALDSHWRINQVFLYIYNTLINSSMHPKNFWLSAEWRRLANHLLWRPVADHLGATKTNENPTNMIKNKIAKPIALLALTACTSLNALAGPAKPAGKAVKEVVAPEKGPLFTGTLEAGWDSRYYFRGLWFADQTVWTGLNFAVPLSGISENLTLGFGALYTSTVETLVAPSGPGNILDYSELDLTASLTYDFKFMKLGVVYTSYQFFDTFSGSTSAGSFGAGEYAVKHVNEVGTVASTTLGPVNMYAAYYYDFNIGGSYIEAGADWPIKIKALPFLTLTPAVKGGYGFDYYSNGAPENGSLAGGVTSGLTHLLVSFAAPMALTKTATVTPYVAWNISGRSRQSNNLTDNEVFGGVKIGISF